MAATLLGILSFLVALTIFFEQTQEHMNHSSVPTMKPVVRQTFAEVTVLGFLSIVTTVAGKCGLWGLLAHVLYGEEVEEEELEELVETAHYTLPGDDRLRAARHGHGARGQQLEEKVARPGQVVRGRRGQ